ncbi:MAG: NAD(P)H-dependent glycerol-3-phosphate dehydrogenase [Coriobacteriales bacterium]|nr:NAD(P)H-dependent glycerol-3-phosphate dehydrogenase [Coriobacteriales bacterium]
MRIAVIGAGSFGTAISWVLGGKGYEVSLYARKPEVARAITDGHRNPRYLEDVVLPDSVYAVSSIAEAASGADAVAVVMPSATMRDTARQLSGAVGENTPVVVLSKGIEEGTGKLMIQVLNDELGNPLRLAALSGPNHAEEVSRGLPAATVVASQSEDTANLLRDLFFAPTFRVYTSHDVIGVELCAAAKNVIAIACGIAAGAGLGDNTAALLMTRGLAEMSRLTKALGGDPLTCMGLAGMGDLIATCSSRHSRNRTLGELIAHGGTLEEFTEKTHMVAEGAIASKTVTALAERYGVELPIGRTVRAMLWEGISLDEAIDQLLSRSPKAELQGIS